MSALPNAPAQAAGSRLIYLMGASGSGKDTLLRLVRAQLGADDLIHIAQRSITRPSGPDEASEQISEAQFEALASEGGFALHWRSHGLCYGIRKNIDDLMAQGNLVIVNGSRRHLAQARARYPDLMAVEIVVDSSVLAARLAARRRENAEQIAARLAVAVLPKAQAESDGRIRRIDNNGAPEVAADALLKLVRDVLR